MDAPARPNAPSAAPSRTAYTVPLDRVHLLVTAAVSVVGLVLVYLVEVCTDAGQRQDVLVFARFQALPLAEHAGAIRDGVPIALGVATVALAVRAVRRGAVRAVVAQVVVVGLAALGSELLKDVLVRPFHGTYAYTYNTFPSSHMATTAALACAVLALWGTARWRAEATFVVVLLVALAGTYNVTGFAHRPSDVVGGVLIATALEGFTLAALGLGAGRARG
ncbi:phosphatase PAP2 family protein [Luteimicrobium sp. NPDC057192]|uniref:phosphatase PAP2 family protein n=1 Tax=Luteimicrobium sp. NPDC057192 TaxID=3346042 RepID=UPI003636C8B1